MELKNKTKFLLVFGIIFVAFLLFNTNKVNAAEISDYKCKVEKDGYIFYNNYFNTSDVNVKSENEWSKGISIDKDKIEQSTFNNIVKNLKSGIFLIEVDSSSTDIKLSRTYYEATKEETITENAKIITLNNKKYVVVNCVFDSDNYSMMNDKDYTGILLQDSFKLINNTNEQVYSINLELTSINAFKYTVNITDDRGTIYAKSGGTNADYIGAYGGGVQSVPSNLDLSKAYVEYLTSEYIGESAQVDNIGIANYVGEYGNKYKYKASLKNAKITIDANGKCIYDIQNLRYKGSTGWNDLFLIDPDYTIDNETYVEKEGTNTDTKLKFDLYGKFKGTLKAEEVSKSDLIYGKVEEKLNKYSSEDLYMWIGNVYIENGSFEGKLKLTFNVGEQYNGKNYFVTHMKNEKYEFEEFTGIVKDGKIEISVDSLSPFGISIFENKTTTETDNTQENQEPTQPTKPTNKGEKDETPKTGTIDIIGYVLATTILAGVGIVALKKNLK